MNEEKLQRNTFTKEHDVHLILEKSATNSSRQDQKQVLHDTNFSFAFSFHFQKAFMFVILCVM